MRAGQLRHKVEIQRLVTTPDPNTNEPIESWETFARAWAEVVDLSGRQFFESAQLQEEISTRVRIRYIGGIQPTMRVIHGSRTLEITSPPIDPDGRRRELHLMCREIQG